MTAAADRAPEGVLRVRAPNPSPLTLDGTNTYVAAGWVVDPGPADRGHLERVLDAAGGAAAIEGIVLTHAHGDHADGAPLLAELAADPPVLRPAGGERVGPFEALATPGHSPDHVCLVLGRVCFTGDTILGAGSVFVAPGEGSMGAYLASLRRLLELDLEVLCPGHGPFVADPRAKIREYLAHRLERERKIVAALDAGLRDRDALLRAAWDELAPEQLESVRPAAMATLEAHLEKLRHEGAG